MARIIKYEDFYRGDTPVFAFNFTSPSDDFDWSAVTIDAAITSVSAPSNNSGAAVLRTGQSLTVDDDNNASYELQPSVSESNALIPNTKYKVQAQLKDNGGTNVATAITGEVKVLQDYII